jgi:SAM-dependent methyltransferase
VGTADETPTERALSFARLPDSLEGWHVLALGPGEPGKDYLTGIGAQTYLALDELSEDSVEGSSFDLVVCGSELETNAHPLALYAWARRAVKPGGILVAGSRVLPDPARSQYARFVPADAPGGASRWIPGQLAFRWMVEVSGFDVSGWLGSGESHSPDPVAYLQAAAADRTPALDLERQPLGR